MTKEEILAMEAGQDLDLVVCREVFANETLGSLKHYSIDISAAWQVVERMAKEGELLLLELESDEAWHAEFGKDRPPYIMKGMAKGKIAPEAICKAALLAKLEVK